MEKPTYTIKQLEGYLLRKKAGYVDVKMERVIQGDSFLQTVVIGLEKTMIKNNNTSTSALLENKKQKNWMVVAPAIPVYNNVNTTVTRNSLLDKISSYFSLQNYAPQYLRIHLLLGFNCSCVVVLVIVACWLNSSQESAMLVSHLEELAGYKP